ncbi:MAG TPA: NAD(P)-binding domain-containing protein [Propionibacteriaceae bacterium]|nr:NAD(P)-binding domain-containing protein [Propionibacteriaceae bacterium]
MPTGRARERVYPRSVGVLGHGFLTEPVLQRLLRALPAATHISTYGRDPDLLAQLQRLGAKTAASPADLAARSEYVLVLLQQLEDLEDDLSGSSGLQAGVHSPTILVMGAICTPDDLRNLASELVDKTAGLLRLVDAPLSGTQVAAAGGNLSIAVGASPGLYREALPVLEVLGTCIRVGGVGSAQIANACEQYVIAATAMALSEAAVIAERAGLDLSCVLHSWELSLAGSRVLGVARAKLLNRDFQADLPASAALAPLEVAAQQAWRTGTSARLLANVQELFQLLDRAGLSSQDLTSTYQYLAAQHPERREAQA